MELYLNLLSQQAMTLRVPITGQFELTPVCNLQCEMCYIHRSEEDSLRKERLLPASFWIKQAEQAVQEGMLVLSITGGETLLYPELDQLMDGLFNLGILISFNTNGTLIDEKRVAWFQQHPVAKINISLYGASNATYASLCGMKNGFDRVSRAIELLQAAGLNVYLNAVLVPENAHELPAMKSWSKAHGLELHTTSYIFPPRGKAGCVSCSLHRLDAEEAAKIAYACMKDGQEPEAFGHQAANMIALLDQYQKHGRQPGFKVCRGGSCSFAITWDGVLRPCVLFEQYTETLEDGFAAAWKRLSSRIGQTRVPRKCFECPKIDICPVCLSAVYQETGTSDQPPEYLCRYTNELEARLRKAAEGISPNMLGSDLLRSSGCNDG